MRIKMYRPHPAGLTSLYRTAPYRRRLACLAICLLSAVICPPVRAGGSWIIDGKTSAQTGDDPSALRTDGTRKMAAPLSFENRVSSPSTGLIRAYAPWDGVYDLFLFDEVNEVLWLTRSPNISFGVGSLAITDSQIISLAHGTGVGFEEHILSGGWAIDPVLDDPLAIINRAYADNRYLRKSAITAPLRFDPSLSSSSAGLFKATVPWDSEYEFFTFDPAYETVVLSPTVSTLGFEAAHLILNGYGNIRLKGEGTYISFEERLFGGGGWKVMSVENNAYSVLNRTYADTRYIQRTEGITATHTVKVGDVLRIQNGIITAINP